MSESNGSVTPEQDFVYDGFGNAWCYSTYADGGVPHWSVTAYDALNRPTAKSDADDDSLKTSFCSKTAGLPSSHIQFTRTYNADGSIATEQNPSEYAAGVSSSFAYDSDGNVTSSIDYKSGVEAPTTNYYDGADRLVEVSLPPDTRTYSDGETYDYYKYAFQTRYIYDLSGGGSAASFYGTNVIAYGGLAETQERLGTQSSGSWTATSATSYDALGRKVDDYRTQICSGLGTTGPQLCTATVENTTFTYDGGGYSGLLSSSTNPANQQTTLQYDQLSRTSSVTNSDSTPSRNITYDADGRVASINSSNFGMQTYTYDNAGELTQENEPQTGTSEPAQLNYSYYADSQRSAVTVQRVGGGTAMFSENFGYRGDGARTYEALTYNGTTNTITKTLTTAGRLTAMSAPGAADSSQSVSYDGYGRPHGYSILNESYSNEVYDAEGELGSDTFTSCQPGTSCSTTQNNHLYNDRGELLDISGSLTGNVLSANGVPVTNTTSHVANWDARNGVVLSYTNNATFSHGVSFNYDTAGRQTLDRTDTTSTTLDPLTGATCTKDDTSSYNWTYDAENHLASTTENSGSTTSGSNCQPISTSSPTEAETYGWGPTNHPYTVRWTWGSNTNQPTSGTETLHWDGDQLLFTSNAQGIGTIFVGKDAVYDVTANSFTATPRDASGYDLFDCSNAEASAYGGGCQGSTQPAFPNISSSHLYISMPRADGINTILDTIQGVRSYNSDSRSWTTPDAYPGNISDPMSLHKYVWAGNDPLAYADPSGYFNVQRSMSASDGSLTGLMMNPGMYNDGGDDTSDMVAQWIDFAEAILEALEAESESVPEAAIEDAWESGGKGLQKAYADHGAELGLSETAYAEAPATLLLSSLKPGGAPAVIGAYGRLYVYDVALKRWLYLARRVCSRSKIFTPPHGSTS